VRIALGARAADVLRLVVGQGVRVAGAGVAVGTVAALGAGRWVGPLLFDTAPHDPVVIGGVALALLGVATAASLVPAWRATRVRRERRSARSRRAGGRRACHAPAPRARPRAAARPRGSARGTLRAARLLLRARLGPRSPTCHPPLPQENAP
jgi:hypothetical protein